MIARLALAALASCALASCELPRLRVFDRDATAADVARDATEDAADGDALAAADARDAVVTADVPPAEDVSVVVRRTASCPDPVETGCARVLVRGATFTLGNDAEPVAAPAQPEVTVGDFVVDATEVTVARFRRFNTYINGLVAAGTPPPDYDVAYPGGQTLRVAGTRLAPPLLATLAPCNPLDNTMIDHHPVNCVDWYTALAFCAWDGGRLPTEAEYELVARYAGDGPPRTYPWGEADPVGRCDRAHWAGASCPGERGRPTRPVHTLSAGRTSADVWELSGNLNEWTADAFVPYAPASAPNECWGMGPRRDPLCESTGAGENVVRGGAFATVLTEVARLRTWYRRAIDPRTRQTVHGMRCVRAASR